MTHGATPLPAPLVHTEAWDDAVSALADGEEPGFDRRILHAHLETCARCRSLVEVDAKLPADFADRIVRQVADDDRGRVRLAIRLALVACGVALLVGAIPELVAAHDEGMAVHAARHLGSFTAAYGAALLVVAIRPARARTMFPVSVVLGAAILLTGLFDVLDGAVPLLNEARHVPELASCALLWLLARSHAVALEA